MTMLYKLELIRKIYAHRVTIKGWLRVFSPMLLLQEVKMTMGSEWSFVATMKVAILLWRPRVKEFVDHVCPWNNISKCFDYS